MRLRESETSGSLRSMDELQRARDVANRRIAQRQRDAEMQAGARAESAERQIGQLVDQTFDSWVRVFAAMADRGIFRVHVVHRFRKRWFKDTIYWEPQSDSPPPPADLNEAISIDVVRALAWPRFWICDDAAERYATMLSRRLGPPFKVRWNAVDLYIGIVPEA